MQLPGGHQLAVLRRQQVAVLQLELSMVSVSDLLGMRMLKRTRLALVSFSLLLSLRSAVACGDDSFIATNEVVDPDASSSGGEGGSAGEAGASAGAGTASGGAGGDCTPGDVLEVGSCEKCGISQRLCDESGQYGAPVCQSQGECEAGAQVSAACGNCGTQERTCQSDCTWGALGACSGEGVCAPGAIDTNCISGPSTDQKLDPCLVKECSSSCQWSACKLKAGAVCAWEAGHNYKCCGTDMWQFCSSASCDWHPCASCNGCSAC